ncbi:MAG: hypothetical protein ACOYMR_05445 [Ilumatobacteraceae bacterium]
MSRRFSAGVFAALLPLIVVACSDGSSTSSSEASSNGNPRLQVRPVLANCSLNGGATKGAPPVDRAVGFSLVIDGAKRVCPTGPGFALGTVSRAEVTNTAPGVAIAVVDLGDQDLASFNTIAEACYAGTPTCPARKIALTLDGDIVSVATVQVPKFESELQLAFNDQETAQRTIDAMDVQPG